jgi:opacity protein-like surface antigen
MSRSTSVVAVLAIACVAVTATAAAQSGPLLGIGAGVTAPQGEFKADASGEGFNAGWQFIALLEFREPKRPVGLRVDLVAGSNPANDQLNADVSAFVGATVTSRLRTVGADVDLVYSLGKAKRGGGPYVLGGIGTYRITLAETSGGVTADTSETKFAWNVGGGLTFPVGKAAMFAEVRYCSAKTTFFNSGTMPFVAATAGFRFGR